MVKRISTYYHGLFPHNHLTPEQIGRLNNWKRSKKEEYETLLVLQEVDRRGIVSDYDFKGGFLWIHQKQGEWLRYLVEMVNTRRKGLIRKQDDRPAYWIPDEGKAYIQRFKNLYERVQDSLMSASTEEELEEALGDINQGEFVVLRGFFGKPRAISFAQTPTMFTFDYIGLGDNLDTILREQHNSLWQRAAGISRRGHEKHYIKPF